MEKKSQLVDAILKSASSKRESEGREQLNCAEAFELAERFEVKVIEIGRICNQHNIRICKCQLGCFV
jgi:hypothetical protein